jgi:hypothetical protein
MTSALAEARETKLAKALRWAILKGADGRLESIDGLFQAGRARASGYRNTTIFAIMIHVIVALLTALIHELTTPCLRKSGYSRFSCGQLFWAHGPVPAICGV